MRILSISVRNYRIHRDLTVNFDPSRNLVGGLNETGKSTLVEAMHRVLFLRAKTSASAQKSIRSNVHLGNPEVTLVFEAAEQIWTLEKRFAGAKGQVKLSLNDRSPLQGDEAETKLSELIQCAEGQSSKLNQIESQWAHLWVWQGKSGDNAATYAFQHKDQLVQRLQEHGLAAVMQSDFDQQVREHVRSSYDDIYTATGKLKTGSKLDSAAKAFNEAEAEFIQKQNQSNRLKDAVADQAAAVEMLAEAKVALPLLRESLASVQESLATTVELQAREEKEGSLYRDAKRTREQLAEADLQIHEFKNQAAKAKERLLPAEMKLSLLIEAESSARQASAHAEATQQALTEEARRARLYYDFASACVSHFEKSDIFEKLTVKAKELEGVHESLAAAREALGEFPSVSQRELNSLHKLDSEFRLAESALTAIAAGVQLISSEQPVMLDGQALVAGQSRVITEVAELTLGSGVSLRIHPGGGNSLDEARQRLTEARLKLAQLLDQFSVSDLAAATEIVLQRQVLEQKISNIESTLQASGAKDLPADLGTASADRNAAAAEVQRRRDALLNDSEKVMPDSIDAARTAEALARKIRDDSDRKNEEARKEWNTRREFHNQTTSSLQSHKDSLDQDRTILNQLETSAKTLEANHGDHAARSNRLELAKVAETDAKTSLDTTLQALAQLDPGQLGLDRDRLSRSIAQQNDKQRSAEDRITSARATLLLDGSQDPEADLVRARGRVAIARDEQLREDRRSKAISLIQKLFTESQTALSEKISQPIADRVAIYLERVFGHGACVRLNFNEGGEQELEFIRPGQATSTFEALSGGAKEQVAAAVRLAMAEILASNHHGCLPLVFDDAFAYADSDRTQSLQRMLDLASSRGLQVILVTCTPSKYSALGAKETRLEPPQLAHIGSTQQLRSFQDDDLDEPDDFESSVGSAAITDESENSFLAKLRALGGSAGNQALCNALGWQEPNYFAVKDSLVSRGVVAMGRGRGGSVLLIG